MSRSYKKVPIMGITGGSSAQKKFKQQEHRKERKAVKQCNFLEEQEVDSRKFGNEWASPRDGKSWFGNCKYKKPGPYINWPEEYKKWLRK